jgi:hypothetical protein
MISAYHQNWMKPLVCPLLNIVVNIRTSEKNNSRKTTQQRMQAGNKMQVPKKASRYHQVEISLRVVATQIAKPRLPNTYFLSSLFKSRGRDFFKGGSLSRPRILSSFGGKFSFLFCLCWLKIHRDLKLLSLFEIFVWKLFKILYLFLEELLWERTSIKMLFSFSFIQTLFKPIQAILQKDIYKMVYKVFYAKGMFYKYISKTIFIEFILWF